ncbi:MAG: helix-turn-helix domain-containing protein [bacterium]|nr:helix-turn-helix domain-containing protein [bacterium]
MTSFQQRSISNTKTLGDRLRQVRIDSNLSIERVANDLQIRKDYIQAIEDSNYKALPSTLFVKNYVRKYAKYLKIGNHATEQLLEEELKVYETQPNIPTMKRHLTKQPLKVFHIILGLSVIFIAVLVAAYFIFEIQNIAQPPVVELQEIPSTVEFDQRFVDINGQTVSEAIVTINDQPVAVKEDGSFNQSVTLQEGVNVFKIVVKTKRSKEFVEYRQIIMKEKK